MNANLYRAFQFGASAARLAVETVDGARFTYADLERSSAQIAHVLRAGGIRPGDRVAAQLAKSPQVLFLYLAVLRVGGVFVPLNPAYTPAELEYFLGDARPGAVVCDPSGADMLRALLVRRHPDTRLETLDADGAGSLMAAARPAPVSFDDEPRGSDDLAALLYTSGTTGRSKGAMLTHGNLASNARTLAECWRFTAADVLLHALPLYHTHGLFVACNVTFMAGASLLLHPRFEVEAALRDLKRASVMMGVPTMYVRLLQEARFGADVGGVRLFISGSAPLLAETHAAFRARTGHAVLERYGMTETNMITSNPLDGERIPGSVGPALPGVSVRIAAAETGAAAGLGEIGVIEVKGPNVFRGYWGMPEKTRQEFRADGYFITGDLGVLDARGYVRIVGRSKDLVISGGFNVYPKEVEAEIDAVAGILESAVIGCPHPDFGEGVTAIVVREPGAAVDAAAILAVIEQRLARFKLPKRIVFVAELPRNAMGKVQKNVLRAEYAGLYRG